MASEGPTTTGSIDAKLTIDKSEWDKKSEEAKAEAKELGSLDPTIKVDANVSGALAKLEAVTAAEKALTAATEEQAKADKERADASARIKPLRDRYDAAVTPRDGSRATADRNAAMPMNLALKAELDKAEAEYARIITASNQARAAVQNAEQAMDAARAAGIASIKAEAAEAQRSSNETVAGINRVEAAAAAVGEKSPTVKVEAKTTEAVADLEKVEAKAGSVGAKSPAVKVDADVGAALTKLSAVALAERNLEVAYQRSAIAQEKLDTVTKKYGEDSIQAASARLTMTRAENAEEDASRKLAQARENESESTKRATQSQRGYTSALGVFIALAPALLGPVAAISAAAVGLGVAFGGMALGGIAAIAGIKHEMEDGTAVGNAYAAGLGTLKGNLSELAQSSANGMLGAFNDVVAETNIRMPFLNQFLAEGSAELGHMGGTALRGVLDGLQQMNPLIQFGAVQLEKFVTWLFSFNGTNGFTQFIQYAMDNLPGTMQLIENLVVLAGRILAAFSPLGPVVLGFLNGLTDLLNGLPLPVLAGLVTTATTIAPAFNIAKAAVATFGVASEVAGGGVTFLGIAANLAIPIVGILTAVIAGVGIAMATSATGTDKNTYALNSYTQALKDDNDTLGEHVRLQAAKALSDAGAYDAARTLGISQTVLTDSLMGVAGAQDIVNDAVKKGKEFQNDWSQGVVDSQSGMYIATDAQNKMGKAIDTVTGALGSQSGAIAQSKQQNEDIKAATDSTTGAMSAQAIAIQGQASMFGVSTSMYQQAMDAQDKAKTSTEQQTVAMQLQNDAAGLLKMAWDELNGKTVTAAQAQNAFDSSLANMGDHIDKTGKKVHFTTTSITDMSAASVALRGQLIGQVTGMEKVIEANGGLENATDSAKQKYADMRQQIIDNAVAHGVDKDAVENYIDSIYKVPVSKGTKIEVEKTQAEKDLAEFQARVDAVHGKTIDLITRESTQKTADTMGTRTNPVTGEQESYVSTPGEAQAPGTGVGTATKGISLGYAHGGSVAYLASGGFPGGPRGTDTTPAWLTPEEFVMKRASAQSIGLPALNYMNETGQLPPQPQAAAQLPPIYVQNPFTGEYLLAQVDSRVGAGISAANQDANRRPSR